MNIIGLGKRVLLTSIVACAIVACMAITCFAYGITGTTFSVSASNPTVTIPVTGAGESQITIVVRTEGDAWLTDPNNNVVYIDQVTGTGATTNITFTVDSKFLVDGATYGIYVGGNGQELATATLVVGDVTPPTSLVKTFVLNNEEDDLTEIGEEKVFAEVTLNEGNGTYAVSVDGYDFLYSVERGVYVGLVADTATKADVVVDTAKTPETFYYGDIAYDEEAIPGEDDLVDGSDLAQLRYIILRKIAVPARVAAADLNASGGIDGTDLAQMRYFLLEKIDAFPATK